MKEIKFNGSSRFLFVSVVFEKLKERERERDRRRMSAEDFQKKVSIRDSSLAGEMETECGGSSSSTVGSSRTLVLLRRLLEIQERRAQAYAKLKRFDLWIVYRH